MRSKEVDFQPKHLGDESGKAFGPPFRESRFDDDILPLDVPEVSEPLPECLDCGTG